MEDDSHQTFLQNHKNQYKNFNICKIFQILQNIFYSKIVTMILKICRESLKTIETATETCIINP